MMVKIPCALVGPPLCAPRIVTFANCCGMPALSVTFPVTVPVWANAATAKRMERTARKAKASDGGVTLWEPPRRDAELRGAARPPFVAGAITLAPLLYAA